MNLSGIAQTVTPLIDENTVGGPGKKAQGRIEYINDSLEPLNVALEAKGFTVSDRGELSYHPLDSSIHLKLSSMSFRIPPKQNYYVFYEASAESLPSWFVVYASFSGYAKRTVEGFRLQLQLPHTIYLLPKRKLQKGELRIMLAEYHRATKQVVLRVENTGPAFGRALSAEVTAGGARITQNGFPVLPNSQRQVEISWEEREEPQKLILRFENFAIEQQVQSISP